MNQWNLQARWNQTFKELMHPTCFGCFSKASPIMHPYFQRWWSKATIANDHALSILICTSQEPCCSCLKTNQLSAEAIAYPLWSIAISEFAQCKVNMLCVPPTSNQQGKIIGKHPFFCVFEQRLFLPSSDLRQDGLCEQHTFVRCQI